MPQRYPKNCSDEGMYSNPNNHSRKRRRVFDPLMDGKQNNDFKWKRRKESKPTHQSLLLLLFVLIALLLPCPSLSFSIPVSTIRRCHAPSMSLFSSSSSSTTSFLQEDQLQQMTVKELRQLVKDSTAERGVLSSLKRKQDLVDYLASRYNDPRLSSNSNRSNSKKQSESARQRSPSKMPPMPDNNNSYQNPKQAVFELVYQRYPPLRELQQQQGQEESEDDEDEIDRTVLTSPYYNPVSDIRQVYHPIFKSVMNNSTNNILSSSDMDVVLVGTASCTPGVTRGVSCTALRLNWRRRSAQFDPQTGRLTKDSNAFQGGTWLFDVGECTQLQVQRTASIKPSKITKIFVTHAHGDHSFGLPGLLCLMGQDRGESNSPQQPIEIYGPEGLRMWLRVAIRYSVSRIVPPYVVHELMDVPMAPEWEFNHRVRRYFYTGRRGNNKNGQQQQFQNRHQRNRQQNNKSYNNRNNNQNSNRWGTRGLAGEDPVNWISQANLMQLEPSSLYGEIDSGRNIYPIYDHERSADGAPVWEVLQEEDVHVYAAPMSHGIPCVGYCVEELERPGRLRNEIVEPIVRRNVAALKEAGFAIPMKAMAVIKNLEPGSAFTFPDGTVVAQEEAVEPPRQGRKVVICGDTADSRAMKNLAKNADVVVHEATNAYLAGVDHKDSTLRDVTRDAIVHGHSTPQLAGEFCRSVSAKRLILNHFSARYKGDTSVDSLSIMMRIEQQAIKAAGLKETHVAAAWDFMVLPLPQH